MLVLFVLFKLESSSSFASVASLLLGFASEGEAEGAELVHDKF